MCTSMRICKGICIVDDDPYFRMILEKRIRRQHPDLPLHFFGEATEMAEAMRSQFLEDWPEIFLIDINLPGDSGWDILRTYEAFFSRHKELGGRTFITSSSVFYTDLEKANSSPVIAGYFTKPVDPTDLGL